MRRAEPDPRRVRIQITAIAPGGKTVPGVGRSITVFDTSPDEVATLIEAALAREATDEDEASVA